MELKNPMLVVTDMDKTVEFYKRILWLQVVTDFGVTEPLLALAGSGSIQSKTPPQATGHQI